MGIEIERKFLVKGEGWRQEEAVLYRQGYLSRGQGVTVRVRVGGGRAVLAIKAGHNGLRREEYEYDIPPAEAEALLGHCPGYVVRKRRHVSQWAGMRWEVDEFLDENAGLVVAEIELTDEEQPFERPPWLGEEVSRDRRYANAQLARHPYCEWKEG